LKENREGLPDEPAFAALGANDEVYSGEMEEKFLPGVSWWERAGSFFVFQAFCPAILEEFSCNLQFGSCVAGRHDPVMADFGEAGKQDMEEESPYELFCRDGDGPFLPRVLVLPGEEVEGSSEGDQGEGRRRGEWKS